MAMLRSRLRNREATVKVMLRWPMSCWKSRTPSTRTKSKPPTTTRPRPKTSRNRKKGSMQRKHLPTTPFPNPNSRRKTTWTQMPSPSKATAPEYAMSETSNGRKLSLKRGTETAASAPRMEERLHKVLAQAGLGSRRALEQRIADGLVKVNGEVAQTGMSIKGGDRVELDGKTFVASALTDPARVLIYNKPEGEVTTREDPEGRPTIFESLPALKGARWIAVGRLDINTTGLLLLTTDGELANAMMHPSFEVEREYVCRVRAPEGEETVSEKIVDRLRRGVALEDGPAKFDQIERIGGTDSHDWFKVVVKEGRNREVRRLWESQGCQVSRLKRVRY